MCSKREWNLIASHSVEVVFQRRRRRNLHLALLKTAFIWCWSSEAILKCHSKAKLLSSPKVILLPGVSSLWQWAFHMTMHSWLKKFSVTKNNYTSNQKPTEIGSNQWPSDKKPLNYRFSDFLPLNNPQLPLETMNLSLDSTCEFNLLTLQSQIVSYYMGYVYVSENGPFFNSWSSISALSFLPFSLSETSKYFLIISITDLDMLITTHTRISSPQRNQLHIVRAHKEQKTIKLQQPGERERYCLLCTGN